MGQYSRPSSTENIPDLIITNIIVVDYTGIYIADVAVKDGLIMKIGNAGNPDIQQDMEIIIGVSTEVISGEGKILTAGAVDTHVHFISPDQIEAALDNGTTTLIGGGVGPTESTKATTCTPGPVNLKAMIQASEHLPITVSYTHLTLPTN